MARPSAAWTTGHASSLRTILEIISDESNRYGLREQRTDPVLTTCEFTSPRCLVGVLYVFGCGKGAVSAPFAACAG